jgi:hypothetical protein
VKYISGLGHREEILEIWKIFGIFLEFFGTGGKWTTVYPQGRNGSLKALVDVFDKFTFLKLAISCRLFYVGGQQGYIYWR